MKCNTYHYFFKNLANPLKISIISILKNKECSVNDLVKELKEEQSKVSHALASLNHCNIVESKQKGKQRIYSLNKKTILPMLKIIDKHKCGSCKVGEK
ncbi:MAG: metalloregulator ArsR/SmtB family transcription factor [Nanoarchaeota archaeon]